MAERKTPNKGYQKLKSDLSTGNIGQVYIFYGEESYLREYYLGEIKKKLVPAGFEEFNFHRVAGKGLTMEELGRIVDVSLRKGYAVNWASDVSENGFGFREGRAIVPVESAAEIPPADSARWKGLTDDEIRKRTLLKTGVLPERQITPEMRQQAFDRYETTDDHGMLIMGVAEDQNGNQYYKVKNSWGDTGAYHGYLYASVPFVLYKSTGIMVRKDVLPEDLKAKLGIR